MRSSKYSITDKLALVTVCRSTRRDARSVGRTGLRARKPTSKPGARAEANAPSRLATRARAILFAPEPARSAQEAPRGPAAAARRGARGGRYHGRALGGDDAPGREGTGGMLVAVGGGGVGGGRAVSKPPKRRASSSPPTPKNALPRSSL